MKKYFKDEDIFSSIEKLQSFILKKFNLLINRVGFGIYKGFSFVK